MSTVTYKEVPCGIVPRKEMKRGNEKESAGEEVPETTPAGVSGAVLEYLCRRLVDNCLIGRRTS